jgi:hypothetical protein
VPGVPESRSKRTTPKVRHRAGLGSNTIEIVAMGMQGRTQKRLNHHYTRELDHSSPSQSGMDHCKRNVERPKSEMGTNIGNTTKNL